MSDGPPAEVIVSGQLVGRLLTRQHPDLAGLPVRLVAQGWDNYVFRLGRELAVRVPRRRVGAQLIEHELRWLPTLAPRLPLPTPVPVRRGEPDAGYPWPWAVVRWVPGAVASRTALGDPDAAARSLAGFLDALHVPAHPGAPVNQFRGGPLATRQSQVTKSAAQVPEAIFARVQAAWNLALAAEPYAGPPLWLHGDLHPGNLLLHPGRRSLPGGGPSGGGPSVSARPFGGDRTVSGRSRRAGLAGVVDFGDLTSGDPACDYACAWLLLDCVHHGPLRAGAERHGPATWQRARGWAASLALTMLANTAPGSPLHEVGLRTVARLDPPRGS